MFHSQIQGQAWALSFHGHISSWHLQVGKNHCCATLFCSKINVSFEFTVTHSSAHSCTLPVSCLHTDFVWRKISSSHLLREQAWQGLKSGCWMPEVPSPWPQECKGRNVIMLEFVLKTSWSILKNGELLQKNYREGTILPLQVISMDFR